MRTTTRSGRRGFTLVEVMVSAAVMSLVLVSVALVTKTGNGVYRTTQARDALRQRTQHALNRIVDAVATASKTTFAAPPALPFGSSTLDFRTPTGIAGGVVSWGPKDRICFQMTGGTGHGQGLGNDGEIVLIRDVDGASLTTVLATHVAEYLEGETFNGADDNGNGLIDERGLSFVLAGDQLTIRVTLALLDPDGEPVWVTTQTQVRLRN
jgi:prepilin-type N-terminal cleavage/methylation domain-containing protein